MDFQLQQRIWKAKMKNMSWIYKFSKRMPKKFKRKNTLANLRFDDLFYKICIEINSSCNRKCAWCPTHEPPEKQGKTIFLEDEVFYSIIDQLLELNYRGLVGFEIFNEPTLDKRLLHFLEYCKERGLRTYFVTNGDLMKKKPELTKSFFNAIGHHIHFSLYDYKDREGFKELKNGWIDYLESLGVERAKYNFGLPYFDFHSVAGSVDRKSLLEEGILEGDLESENKLPLKKNCRKPFGKINIAYNGKVPICCLDAWMIKDLGNIRENTIAEIWWGEKRKYVCEQLLLNDRSKLVPCNTCTATSSDR